MNKIFVKRDMARKDIVKILKISSLVVAFAALGACTSSSLFGSNDANNTDTITLANAEIDQSTLAQAPITALPAIATQCPPIRVKAGGGALFSYAKNRIGDAQSLIYQARIDNQSRNCVVSNGLITVKMGAVGRVLLGPASSKNQITVPLRFVVERDDIAVFSQKYDIPVTITPPSQSEEFIKVVENVAIPYIGGENIVIWVGFDTKS